MILGLSSARLLCPWDFSCKNPGVGCHFLLQGIFPIQGWVYCLVGGFFTAEPAGKLVEASCTKCGIGWGKNVCVFVCVYEKVCLCVPVGVCA